MICRSYNNNSGLNRSRLTTWCIIFDFRGVKATLWEGGVRGTGFIHSPLFTLNGYVSEQLVHVCDWLPTLYSAAGGNPADLGNVDGVDMWKMFSTNGKPQRTELLHNMLSSGKTGALRVGDYKLLTGKIPYFAWDGWYPPYQLPEDSRNLHYTKTDIKSFNFKDFRTEQTFKERDDNSVLKNIVKKI